MKRNEFRKIALDGLIRQNPVLRLVLGTCPTLALSTAVSNALGMGAAVTFVLVCSNMMISLLRNVIPDKIRIPAFVTITQLVVQKFSPELYESLGVYLPLVVVNCIILARAESFASANKVIPSMFDGLFMGLGYTLGLTVISTVREILGFGTFLGIELWSFKIGFFAQAPGAFFTFGMAILIFNLVSNKIEKKRNTKYHHLKLTVVADNE